MKKSYSKPETEIVSIQIEHFIAASPTGRIAADTPTQGENAIDTEVGYTSSGDFEYSNRHGQGEEGGNRAKGATLWDDWN